MKNIVQDLKMSLEHLVSLQLHILNLCGVAHTPIVTEVSALNIQCYQKIITIKKYIKTFSP